MDLWDLTRLLFRRWYFALPILLVSMLMAVIVSQTVEPDYRATGNVVMIPAPGDPADEAARAANKPAPTRPKNPWLDLGFEALGSAAILKVMDQDTLKTFDRNGLSASVTVTLAQRNPIFNIEVVGASPTQATATVREVIQVLSQEVAAQQARYGVMPQDTITTLTLTDGADVETVTSKVKRILIVTVGLGLLLTAAGTIGLDVLIRLRRNRRPTAAAPSVGAAPGPKDDDEDEDDGMNGFSGIRPNFVPSRADETQVITRVPAARNGSNGAKVSNGSEVELAKAGGRSPSAGRRPVQGGAAEDDKRGGGRRTATAAPPKTNGDAVVKRKPASDSDATIILPVPRRQWAERDDRTGER